MIAAVLDASVVAKLLLREEGSSNARALLASLERPVVPDWCLLECAGAISRHSQDNGLSPETAILNMGRLERLGLETIASQGLVRASLELALQYEHSPYDCLYVLRAYAEEMPLVTADRAQHRLAERILGDEHAILLNTCNG